MSTRILLTAFEPFGGLSENSSLLCLRALVNDLAARPLAGMDMTTRVVPVDFVAAKVAIEEEIVKSYDFALHLGQAAGSAALRLETFAVNAGVERAGVQASACREGSQVGKEERHAKAWTPTIFPLAPDGPAAYQSSLPLVEWAARLNEAGVPAEVSFHAGTYLCNAVYYWSRYFTERAGAKTRSMFIHLPLAPCQSAEDQSAAPALDLKVAAAGVRLVLDQLANRHAAQ